MTSFFKNIRMVRVYNSNNNSGGGGGGGSENGTNIERNFVKQSFAEKNSI
jgi:hypothetical protein